MRHICSRCRLTSQDGNLWCQEVDCPAGSLPVLFKFGDFLGNLKVVELLRVLRSATLYRVERETEGKLETLLMKVANPGAANEAYLKREAESFRLIAQSKYAHQSIAKWVHHGAVNGQDPFGIATRDDQTRYYILLDNVEGEFLTDTLLDNALPWHEHVGWFVQTLAEGVIRLHQATNKLHLNLNPDMVMVWRNNSNVPLPVMIDLGLQEPFNRNLLPSELDELQAHTLPAYTPPELVVGGVLTPKADVYGLGLILFEMLAGHPAFAYQLRRTQDIFEDIENARLTLERADLPVLPRRGVKARREIEALVNISRRAVEPDATRSYRDAAEFRNALHTLYGEVDNRFRFTMEWFFKNVRKAALVGWAALFVIFVLSVLITALTRPLGG